MRRDLLILLGLVLLIRLPFIAQPIQGDDVYYLIFAKNALVDPLHPLQTSFRLQGETVWGAGHTRPPGVAWTLAPLLALLGGVREVPLHLAYVAFSLIAVFSVYFLARRFSGRPLWAALLFGAAPAFVINGNKLESDVPLVAFLALGGALLVHRRYWLSALAMAAGAFFGYQSVLLAPVFAHWVWFRDRSRASAWSAVVAAPLALAAWQLAERAATGAAPAEALAGYAASYDFFLIERKLRSGVALLGHLGFVLSPVLVIGGWASRSATGLAVGAAGGVLGAVSISGYGLGDRVLYAVAAASACILLAAALNRLVRAREEDDGFLAAWVIVCFAGSVALFYAGSARYLLPLAPALAVMAVRFVASKGWLLAGLLANLTLGLALAHAEFDYARQYQRFAAALAPKVEGSRLWTNGEWGLRYYLGELGAEPLLAGQSLPGGAVVATSELAAAISYGSLGSRHLIMEREVRTGLVPLRTIGAGSGSGYSSSEFGVLPFGLGPGVIDRLTAEELGLPEPTYSYLSMNAADAESQLLSGFYELQSDTWRWMGPSGTALLAAPEESSVFEIDLDVPDNSPARRIAVEVGGRVLLDRELPGAGSHRIQAPVAGSMTNSVRIVIRAEPAFSPPGDARDLTIVVNSFGFRP